jgi:hypothetical protein
VYTVGETGTMYTPASGQYYSGNTTAVTYSQVNCSIKLTCDAEFLTLFLIKIKPSGMLHHVCFLQACFIMLSICKIICICDCEVNEMEHWWNDTDRKTKVLGGKPIPVPLCPLQVPHGLAWD